jgi:hypothetical protein
VNLSITEERLAWLDEYAASKRWHRSVLIAELIDGFRARLAANTPVVARQAICPDGKHQRGEVGNGGIVQCRNCPAVKVNQEWVVR